MSEENPSRNVSLCLHILWLRTPAVCAVTSTIALRCSPCWLAIYFKSWIKRKIILIYFSTESAFIAVGNIFFYAPSLLILAIPLDIPAHSNASGRTMSLYQWSNGSLDICRIIPLVLTRCPKIPDRWLENTHTSILCCAYNRVQQVRLTLTMLQDSMGTLCSSVAFNKQGGQRIYCVYLGKLPVCVYCTSFRVGEFASCMHSLNESELSPAMVCYLFSCLLWFVIQSSTSIKNRWENSLAEEFVSL